SRSTSSWRPGSCTTSGTSRRSPASWRSSTRPRSASGRPTCRFSRADHPAAVTTPAGFHTVTPRVVVEGADRFVAFLNRVFGVAGKSETSQPAQIRIGDSLLMIGEVGEREAFPAFLYVYVEDVDAVFRRAVEAGAEVLEAPERMPYGDRRAMVKDSWG